MEKIDRVMLLRRRLSNVMYHDYLFSLSLLKLTEEELETLENIVEKIEPK